MSLVRSFPPIATRSARLLILGSMPGVRSLAAGQYYAHPHNSFWRILGEILHFDAAAPYAERTLALTRAGIALWDVLQSCVRPGSLDSAIERDSRVPNDFAAFFRGHPRIERVCFNGGEAERSFRRYVAPVLADDTREYRRLPSTSPAHAGLPFAAKLAAWREALE
ncbi:MAG TPA: DNA-deoxyinosine glycosylase [Rudaea sp.]|nr:DNA-deoxyinosine glycosylase [Rudaea sp.]